MIKTKEILVTGSDGFIGKKLVQSLQSSGHTVHQFDRLQGDISSYQFDFHHLDHIIHLASMVYVPASWEDPYAFYKTNLLGTVNMLELCRRLHCRLIYISSYVYGIPQYLPVDEKHPVHPASPYNHSKLLAEETCSYYSREFQVPVVIFRPANIFGPGQNGDFLIPKILRQVIRPEVETIEVMDLRPRRDYLFINDFIEAIVSSLDLTGFNLFNIGSGRSWSVEEIIQIVMHLTNIQKTISSTHQERKNEIFDIYMDNRKISENLGWKPSTSFGEGIIQCLSSFNI
jgi:nucleoside-diphosphate-sugar epimerase